ncbi:MAG: flavin reductase family protein [Rickettsiaceae bacterium]|nr:flavin reductase family protein [Rickettsiaceae bacterium]MDP4832086.1 flavin reductase family protein [Rickettsiaceae bacterium]MDP5020289.1 flavin reductase family protein [Rickettsiaceae bacterium]MDP5083710.1 flavin reductase family protein [Rickettsiaceae bacterium]
MHNEEFKEAVGKFPTGVTVISTSYDNKLWGFTANSFVSVSLTPPLVSFCLDKGSGSFKAFNKMEYFAINILSNEQAATSKHFANKGKDKFSNIEHEISEFSGNPLIVGAVCFIECKKYKQFECGDHVIFVGEVVRTKIDQSKPPLLYFAKSYKEIQ